jgi:hypothetical protein
MRCTDRQTRGLFSLLLANATDTRKKSKEVFERHSVSSAQSYCSRHDNRACVQHTLCFARTSSLVTTKPLCHLPQHRTLYTRVLSKLNCPLANTRALGKVDCSSAHRWTREELEGTPSDQRVGNYLPSNHHLPTRSPSHLVYYLPKQRVPSLHAT